METSKKYKLLGIIDGCRKLGVSKIKTPEFEVEFFLERSQEVGDFVDISEPTKPSPIDKELLNDVRMSQLMIDDPFSFEREVIEAEQRRLMNDAVQN